MSQSQYIRKNVLLTESAEMSEAQKRFGSPNRGQSNEKSADSSPNRFGFVPPLDMGALGQCKLKQNVMVTGRTINFLQNEKAYKPFLLPPGLENKVWPYTPSVVCHQWGWAGRAGVLGVL